MKNAVNAKVGARSEETSDFLLSDDIHVSEPETASEAVPEPEEEELSAPIMSDGLSSAEEKTQKPAPKQEAQSSQTNKPFAGFEDPKPGLGNCEFFTPWEHVQDGDFERDRTD